MKARRCEICGGFYEGPECPQGHPPPPPPPPAIGSVIRFPWPHNGQLTLGLITSDPDDEEQVGVMVLNENVRINRDDLKEI